MQLGFLPENAGFCSMVTESLLWYGWWKKSCTSCSWYDKKSHYSQGFKHPRWCRISSINSIDHGMSSFMLFTPASWFNEGSTLVTAENQGSTCSQPSFCLWFFFRWFGKSVNMSNDMLCVYSWHRNHQKKWGGHSAWTKAPFSIRRRSEDRRSHEIPGRWLFGVQFPRGSVLRFFPPDDRWPLVQQILAPCFNTLPWRNCECCTGWDFGSGWEKVRNVFLEIWEKVRTSPELKVKSQNLSMHHPPPLFLSNFPFGELPEPFGQFQSLLDQLRKRAGTSPSKVLMDVNRHVATYFVETFPSEGRLHSHGDPSNATTAGMAGTLLQGQRPWSLGILRFWTTNFLRSSKQLMQLINWGLEVVVQWNFGGNSVGAQKIKRCGKKHTKAYKPWLFLWFCFGVDVFLLFWRNKNHNNKKAAQWLCGEFRGLRNFLRPYPGLSSRCTVLGAIDVSKILVGLGFLGGLYYRVA